MHRCARAQGWGEDCSRCSASGVASVPSLSHTHRCSSLCKGGSTQSPTHLAWMRAGSPDEASFASHKESPPSCMSSGNCPIFRPVGVMMTSKNTSLLLIFVPHTSTDSLLKCQTLRVKSTLHRCSRPARNRGNPACGCSIWVSLGFGVRRIPFLLPLWTPPARHLVAQGTWIWPLQ